MSPLASRLDAHPPAPQSFAVFEDSKLLVDRADRAAVITIPAPTI